MSHYWDCRLKGRPPGTPKSEDPSKKKRKRTARPRDLCDVKIKITEYYPGALFGDTFPDAQAQLDNADPNNFFASNPGGSTPTQGQQQPDFTMLSANTGLSMGSSLSAGGGKYYTIQRVNGNGGNGKGDGVAGPHKHTLAYSDAVKKNSVQRTMLKDEKNMKQAHTQVRRYDAFFSRIIATLAILACCP